jgi:hypothetical protein
MNELFRLKIVSKRQLTVPQRLMDITGLSQGDELHLRVSDGRITGVRPFPVRPEDQVSQEASARMDEAEAAFEQGDFEVEELEQLIGSQPAVETAPAEEAQPRGMEFRMEPERRPRRGRWKGPYPQRVPGYATYVNRFDLEDERSSPIFSSRPATRVSPRNFHRDDDKIYDSVGEALSDAGLDVADVEIAVQQGVVKLSGTVAERRERLAAEDIASQVLGVQDVENNIQVRLAPATAQSAVPDRTSIARTIDRARQRRGAEAGLPDEY